MITPTNASLRRESLTGLAHQQQLPKALRGGLTSLGRKSSNIKCVFEHSNSNTYSRLNEPPQIW